VLAVAAVVVVAAIAAVLSRDGDGDDVVASAELEQLVETGTAQATLVRVDGEYRLDLEIEGVEADDGFLELWLLGPDDEPDELRLISLGVVNESGSYAVPAGIELSAFPIVDISVEPFDGNPSHSGDSLLRGELDV
jgi:anti-sigma-K factor RskA